LMKDAHVAVGHRGREATFQLLAQQFRWPGMYRDVAKFVAACLPCQRDGPLEATTTYWSRPLRPIVKEWAIDFVVLPAAQGKRYILDARCTFSGSVEAVPTR
ncbi:hypothetical protein BCR44DRAFT_110147, partial [Catenaria anguillulae PL171]